MHFWIDKRSPQCGFGRSRVAASLHTGGSGLSFGHPPRRSGGHKTSAATTSSSSSATASNTGIPVHRQQQQQHSHTQQQTQQAQYQQQQQHHPHGSNAATSSNNSHYRSSNYPSGSCSTSNNNNINNSGGVSINHASNRNLGRPNVATSSQHYYNNNRQYQQQQQQQQQQHQQQQHQPNSSNNNHSSLAVTTQNLTSPTGNNLNSTINNDLSTAQQPQRYRHPQFGNMSVRTYQPASQSQHQQQLQQQPTATTTLNQNSIASNQLQQQQPFDASLNILNEHGLQTQSPNQTANLSAELCQQSPRVLTSFARPLTATTMSPAICEHNNLATNPRPTTNYTNTTLCNNISQQPHHHQQQHPRQRRAARSIESTDLQFLPLHLKCGIFASLVLAVAFIVGIKVYFDNHGTKFEVGLFWLLTATFVFAFCFVSICKVPRVLFASSSQSSRSNSRDQTRDICSMEDVAARGSMVNSIDDVVVGGLHEFQQEQMQININAHAGPPPYHIAILLPESTKAKEDITTLEESPPPSYDKILI